MTIGLVMTIRDNPEQVEQIIGQWASGRIDEQAALDKIAALEVKECPIIDVFGLGY